MTPDEARRRFAAARVARLATAGTDGVPHLVPVVFAVDGHTVYSAVDHKPKRTAALRRLANVAANPAVALLVDHYDDDWTRLWWVRADGAGRVLSAGSADVDRAIRLLCDRYPQYAARPPAGPVLAVDVVRWSGWAASDGPVGQPETTTPARSS
ncbi:MAG TPA: TIGR03668 family PPOX class F420-dependent oxidoreductase [Acidimicrobiales bacterium]|nr:TIGR03668 family PPOX class F420-dependent oxidoreductase [Acidimicrobiales bacterium]